MIITRNDTDNCGDPAVAEITRYLALLPKALETAWKTVENLIARSAPKAASEHGARWLAYCMSQQAVRLVILMGGDYEIRLRGVEGEFASFEATGKEVVINKGSPFETGAIRGRRTTWPVKFLGGNQNFAAHSQNPFVRGSGLVEVGDPTTVEGVLHDGGDFQATEKPVLITGMLPTVGERAIV